MADTGSMKFTLKSGISRVRLWLHDEAVIIDGEIETKDAELIEILERDFANAVERVNPKAAKKNNKPAEAAEPVEASDTKDSE